MATTALGVMQLEDGTGCDPMTHRRIIKARWANPGIIAGLVVTGNSDLTYHVSQGNAVLCRSDTDGYTEAWWQGGDTPAVSAGDPSNPRIDTVWLRANDAQQGDEVDGEPNNRVVCGVAQGTPSASPVAPDAPAGCTAVGRMLVPAGATAMSSATRTDQRSYAIPYGASLGLLGSYRDTAKGKFDTKKGQRNTRCAVQVTVPTDRLVDVRFTAGVYCSGSAAADDHTSWYVAFKLDGEEVDYSGGEFHLNCETCEAQQRTTTLEVPSGTHTIAVATAWVSGEACPAARYGSYKSQGGSVGDFTGTFPGKLLEVWDRGPAS